MKNFFKKHYKLIIYNILICLLISMVSLVNKRVYALVDGVESEYTTNVVDVDYFVEQVAKEHNLSEYKSTINVESDILVSNSVVEIRSLKEIQVTYDGNTTLVKTYANDFEELMSELDLDYTEDDDFYLVENQDVLLKDVSEVAITRIQSSSVVEKRTVELAAVEVENPNLTIGIKRKSDAGIPEIYDDEYLVIKHNGVEVKKTLVNSTKIQEGVSPTIEIGTSKPITYKGDSVWDDIAQCETGARWNLNTGNGYYGGLQFSAATWRTASNAVGLNIEYANQATREEQILAAQWLLENTKSGFGQWPACSAKLGLI